MLQMGSPNIKSYLPKGFVFAASKVSSNTMCD